MQNLLRPAVSLLGALTVLTGLVYPLIVTTIAQVAFPHQANGSLIVRHGQTVGSELIGQSFASPRYFWGRLSATSPAYNAAASSGSNYGPLNPALQAAAGARVTVFRMAGSATTNLVPVDLVTASGSGLDPHISRAAAAYQVARVARARGLTENQVRQLVARSTQGRTFGVLGEPRVNVLNLNLALDNMR